MAADARYGVEVYFNGVLVQPQIIIRPDSLGVDFETPQFTLQSVNGGIGPGFDNIVSLKGINYNNDGGGNWMGIDYIQLNRVQLKFLPATVTDGNIVLNWTGIGQVEWRRVPAGRGRQSTRPSILRIPKPSCRDRIGSTAWCSRTGKAFQERASPKVSAA